MGTQAKALRDARRVGKCALLSVLLLSAGYLCLKIQLGVLLFLPSIGLFALLMLIHRVFGKGAASFLKFTLAAIAVVAALSGGLYLSRELLATVLRSLTYVPKWASFFAADGLFYGRVLYHQNALLWFLFPVGVFVAVSRNTAAALYFASLFVGPCMILSCLPMKQDRFLHHVYPFGVVFISVCIVVWLGRALDFLRRRAEPRRRVAGALAWACMVVVVAGNTAFAYERFSVSFPPTPDWKQTCSWLRSSVSGDDVVVTDNAIAVLYYLGRVDWVMDENLLEISRRAGWRDTLGRWRDYQTNALHLTSVEDAARLVAGGRRLWILLGHEGSGFRDLQRFVGSVAERISDESIDREIRVYRIGS